MRRNQLTLNANPQGRPNGAAAPSPGQVTEGNGALGCDGRPYGALKEQKRMNLQCGLGLLPFQGATSAGIGTQGVAHLRSLTLGLEFDGLSGRLPCGVIILIVCRSVEINDVSVLLNLNTFFVRLKLCQSAGTPQRGSSTKPRASDRGNGALGCDGRPYGALKGQ